ADDLEGHREPGDVIEVEVVAGGMEEAGDDERDQADPDATASDESSPASGRRSSARAARRHELNSSTKRTSPGKPSSTPCCRNTLWTDRQRSPRSSFRARMSWPMPAPMMGFLAM